MTTPFPDPRLLRTAAPWTRWIFLTVLVCLIAGHGLILPLRTTPLLWAAPAPLLLAGCILYRLGGRWPFLLAVFILSHFCFANNQGGLWNFLCLLVLLPAAISTFRRKANAGHFWTNVLLGVLVGANVLGIFIHAEQPLAMRIQGLLPLLAYVLVFRMVSRAMVTLQVLRHFYRVLAIVAVLMLGIGLLQRFQYNTLPTPLLGYYSEDTATRRAVLERADTSIFDNSELYGEYSVMICVVVLPLTMLAGTREKRLLPRAVQVLTILACAANVCLSASRSSAILLMSTFAIYLAITVVRGLRTPSLYLVAGSMIVLLIGGLATAGAMIGVDIIAAKFAHTSLDAFTIEGVLNGHDINRGWLFDAGLRRLSTESWWVGFGNGVPDRNRVAWTGSEQGTISVPGIGNIEIADYHSLYIQLPMLYGWFGAAAFLLLILRPAFAFVRWKLSHALSSPTLTHVAIGLVLAWAVFFIDEFKIAALRSASYQMIIWFWLGLTYAILRSVRTWEARS